MSGAVIKISVAFDEKILAKIIENLNGSHAIFIVTGENASKFSARVICVIALLRLIIIFLRSRFSLGLSSPPPSSG